MGSALPPPVGETGFEPATPASRTQCSTGLSYSPKYVAFPVRKTRTGRDSNPRGLLTPHDFQSCSLSHSDTCPTSMSSGPGRRSRPSERRGWDSNPREPFGPDGLANRCRNHLATSPTDLAPGLRGSGASGLRSYRIQMHPAPLMLRLQSFRAPKLQSSGTSRKLPLLGSNQDSSDPESDVLPVTPRGSEDHRAGDGARTRDPQLGKLMLYQLSYSRTVAEPPVRIELTTARLRIECSTSELRWQERRAPARRHSSSGAEGSRTPDLCSAIAALSQLSYSPVIRRRRRAMRPLGQRHTLNDATADMGARGLEPLTSTMST